MNIAFKAKKVEKEVDSPISTDHWPLSLSLRLYFVTIWLKINSQKIAFIKSNFILAIKRKPTILAKGFYDRLIDNVRLKTLMKSRQETIIQHLFDWSEDAAVHFLIDVVLQVKLIIDVLCYVRQIFYNWPRTPIHRSWTSVFHKAFQETSYYLCFMFRRMYSMLGRSGRFSLWIFGRA